MDLRRSNATDSVIRNKDGVVLNLYTIAHPVADDTGNI